MILTSSIHDPTLGRACMCYSNQTAQWHLRHGRYSPLPPFKRPSSPHTQTHTRTRKRKRTRTRTRTSTRSLTLTHTRTHTEREIHRRQSYNTPLFSGVNKIFLKLTSLVLPDRVRPIKTGKVTDYF